MQLSQSWIRLGLPVVLVVIAVVRLATLQGWWRPVRISGGSMAETLVGDHFEILCKDCGFFCCYDAEAPPRDDRVVCPNCGFVNDHAIDGSIHRGRRVLIDRLVYAVRKPRRWDVVAFRTPGDEQWLSVKRVVGLPGERVAFRQGDLLIDGQLARKSLDQLRQMAVLVHDNDYRPNREERLPPRWQAERSESRWQAVESEFRYETNHDEDDSLRWIQYQHWPCYAGSVPRTKASPVSDNYGYNQQVSRELNVVRDILLSCHVRTPGQTGRLAFEISDRGVRHRVELRFDTREIVLNRDTEQLKQLSLPHAGFARGVEIELALSDGQLLFGIDRDELIRENCEPSEPSAAANDRQLPRLAIGGMGLTATVDRLRVLRDLYYFLPADALVLSKQTPPPLGPGEVFVVGDNVPISHDSRHRQPPGVPIDNLLGRIRCGRFK